MFTNVEKLEKATKPMYPFLTIRYKTQERKRKKKNIFIAIV